MSDKDGLILAALARLEAGQQSLQSSVLTESSAVREDLARLWAAVSALEEGQIKLREDQTSLRVGLIERMDRLQDMFSSVREDQTSLRVGLMERMDRLQDMFNSVREDQTSLRVGLMERMDRLQDMFGSVREDQTSLRVGLMERMDRLQDMFSSIRDDITVSMGRGDHAERIALQTREEVRSLSEVVSAMHKQIARLQTQVRELRGDP